MTHMKPIAKIEKNYLDRLTKHPHVKEWALVKCAVGESWHPNWSGDKFLIFLQEDLTPTNKSKTYFIYCCGMDDGEQAIRNLKWSIAKDLFDKATRDGISRKELEVLGIVRE